MHASSFAHPEHNLNQVQVTEGMRVADLGAGAGFLTLALLRRVGNTGRVYAVDIQEGLLERLRNEALARGFSQSFAIVRGDLEKTHGTKLEDTLVDLVVLSNTMFQIEAKETLAQEIFRITKPGGEVLVIDWSESFGHLGPHPGHVITKDAMEKVFLKAGLALDKEFDAGAHHYGLVFKK